MTTKASEADDRELLEMAAKAAGIAGKWDPFMGEFRRYLDEKQWFLGKTWNPLTDDGDALRLAVKLGMQVDCSDGSTAVFFDPSWADKFLACEAHESDPCAATRRAIVRAAAITKGA